MNADALKCTANVTPCQAVFYAWEELSNLYTAILSSCFERTITVGVTGDERGDGWFLQLGDTPLSKEELNTLLDTLKADGYDRDANDFGEYPIQELSQSIGQMIAALTFPFPVDASHAADDGVWFTGRMPAEIMRLFVSYPELEAVPDLLTVAIDGPAQREAVISAYFDALNKVNSEESEESNGQTEDCDRFARLRTAAFYMEHALGVKVTIFPINAEGAIGG